MSGNKFLKKIEKNSESLKIFYKLAVDFLFLSILATFLFLLSEAFLPGIASEKIGFIKMVFFIFLDLAWIYFLGSLLGINLKKGKEKKNLFRILGILLVLFVFSGLLKANIFLALLILVVSLVIYFLFFKTIFEE